MRGFYYHAQSGGRLYFSENEIGSVSPVDGGGYILETRKGGRFRLLQGAPSHVEHERQRPLDPRAHYFIRS